MLLWCWVAGVVGVALVGPLRWLCDDLVALVLLVLGVLYYWAFFYIWACFYILDRCAGCTVALVIGYLWLAAWWLG